MWRVVAGCGRDHRSVNLLSGLWRVAVGCGELWRVVASCGMRESTGFEGATDKQGEIRGAERALLELKQGGMTV